jgi:hypothetical protein
MVRPGMSVVSTIDTKATVLAERSAAGGRAAERESHAAGKAAS